MSEEQEKFDPGIEAQWIEPYTPQSREINELATALAKAQGQIKGATKDTTNPHFKSKYADLSSVWDACREPLSKNGLSVIQYGASNGAGYVIRTRLMHSSGQWMEGETPCIISGRATNEMQALGSAITYARRYGLAAIVGVAPEDDDGEGAAKRPSGDKVWTPEEDVAKWVGPLGKDALKKKMRAFAEELKVCEDPDMLAGLLHSYKDVHLQCSKEVGMEEWWDKAAVAIGKKQNEFNRAESFGPLDAG